MTNIRHDPRLTKCAGNTREKHRWAQSFKDKVSKGRYIQILRCRYCAKYLQAEFERVVLPSGRVNVVSRVTEVEEVPEVTVKLQAEAPDEQALQSIVAKAIATLR